MMEAIERMRKEKEDVFVWGPACGFTEESSFSDERYEVPAGGLTAAEAIELFLRGEGKWLLDEVEWPDNEGCNGLKRKWKALDRKR